MEKIAVTEPSESGATDEAPGRTCRPGGMQPLPEKGLQNRARAGKKYTNSFLLPAGKEPHVCSPWESVSWDTEQG